MKTYILGKSATQACGPVILIVAALMQGMLMAETEKRFVFTPGPTVPGAEMVGIETLYNPKTGFGFLEQEPTEAQESKVFATNAEEGNYELTMRFGASERATSTTVWAESRRLMLENIITAPGEFITRSFTVNVRKPAMIGGGSVSLNDREKGPPMSPSWDDRLTLRFGGAHPGVAALQIKPNASAVTVFLAGDSTVADQHREPWTDWGQMLPRFFGPGVAVSNHAESGLALRSFERQKRLDKILSMMRKGDYLFVQFGHNDQKDKTPGAGPFTSYKENLKRYVAAVKAKGGIPVLVTPVERRRWSGDTPQPTLADYAEAVRQTGTEENATVIDLNALSLKLYAALGPEKSTKAFVHYPAGSFPDQKEKLSDNSHHNAYGAYQLARCVTADIRVKLPDLAKLLAEDAGDYDPSKPDAPEKIDLYAHQAYNKADDR